MKIMFSLALTIICTIACAQTNNEMEYSKLTNDSLTLSEHSKHETEYKVKPLQLVVPSLLVGLGFVGLGSDWLKYQNHEIRDELQENIDRRFTLDDFSQYIPTVSLYIPNLFGITGKHDVLEKTQLLCTAYLLMEVSVNSIKYLTKVERPDGSSRNSFPSGHTAAAFVGAELVRREYGHRSTLISIAGYAIAAGTVFSECTTTDTGLLM